MSFLRVTCWMMMAASAGALLFMIPSMVGMYKMTSKPWYFPKDWFFIPFLVILGGVALEWCFRSARCKTEDIDKDSK